MIYIVQKKNWYHLNNLHYNTLEGVVEHYIIPVNG